MEYSNKILFTAGIHFNPKLEKYIENPFEELENIIEKEKPKIICLCGDIFDRSLTTDSTYYQEKIRQILKISKLTKYLIILQGTLSHDQHSLNVFDIIGKNYQSNIYYIKTKQILEIENFKILCLPEEYPQNTYNISWDDYYNFDNINVDFIIGHGNIKGARLHSKINNFLLGDNGFSKQILNKICSKLCVFGHIHIPQQLEEKVYYVGSLARTHFGDEEDKRILLYDIDNNSIINKTLTTTTNFITIDKNTNEIIKNQIENTEYRIKGTKEFISNIQEQFQTQEINNFKIQIESPQKQNKNNLLNEITETPNILKQFQKCFDYDILHGNTKKKDKEILKWDLLEQKIINIINQTKNKMIEG